MQFGKVNHTMLPSCYCQKLSKQIQAYPSILLLHRQKKRLAAFTCRTDRLLVPIFQATFRTLRFRISSLNNCFDAFLRGYRSQSLLLVRFTGQCGSYVRVGPGVLHSADQLHFGQLLSDIHMALHIRSFQHIKNTIHLSSICPYCSVIILKISSKSTAMEAQNYEPSNA